MTNEINKEQKVSLAFAAINKTIETNIPQLTQEEVKGKDYVQYGEDNAYPQYLYTLYTDVSTLKTIIDGSANYVAGDDVLGNVPGFETRINRKGDTWRDFVKNISRDYFNYGGFSYEVIRNKAGKIGEIYYKDFRNLRTNKKNEVLYYSEDFGKRYGRTTNALVYPKFIADADADSSIVYVKNSNIYPYPVPRFSGAIKACEIERHIDEMHLNSLENGFMGSYLISFLNGIPADEEKAEIEKNIQEKFTGSKNAGRVVLNFANGKDNAATVERLDITDFADKYKAAADRSREQIYCAFQAIPQLFGLMAASTGFNEQEFVEAFKLYNRTVIRDIQRLICDSLDYVFGMKDSLTIKPFSLSANNESNVN